MTRLLAVVAVLACAAIVVPAGADDPPKKLTAVEREELEAKWKETNAAGLKALQAQNFKDAAKAFEEGLKLARRRYNAADFPDGHDNLATALSNLGFLYRVQGKHAAVELLFKDALEMRKRLLKGDHLDVADSLNNLGTLYFEQRKYAAAEPLLKELLEMRKRLLKGDHPDVAQALNNLGTLYRVQGMSAAAEPLFTDALEIRKRLFKGDHPDVARSLNNLAVLYEAQGKSATAEPLLKDALDMRKRLSKDKDHPDVATSLNNLGVLYRDQAKYAAAESLVRDALEMRKRLFPGDHRDVASSLNNLAGLYRDQGKEAAAQPLLKDALEMRKRLFPGDHQDVASSLNNLATLYQNQGNYTAAEPMSKDALEMLKRLYPGDHDDVARSLHNLAVLYEAQGKYATAEPLVKEALEMYRRIVVGYARQKSEGEALTLAQSHPLVRDGYLSVARLRAPDPTARYDPATAYSAIWVAKGHVARVFEQRQLRARAAAADPVLAAKLDTLADTRRRRADRLLGPVPKDPDTAKQRQADLKAYDEVIAKLDRELADQLPAVARITKLDAATLTDLQKALPADVALVDYFRYTFFEWDDTKPPGEKQKRTPRYLAFVVMRDKVAWVDLDTAGAIEPAVVAWREAITGDPARNSPPASAGDTAKLGAKVRGLVWDGVRKHLPAPVKVVYVCPDAALCKLPFAALPGDRPNTILLDDFAVAAVPHAPFLLDQLWPQDPLKNPPTAALVVGGVEYDAAVTTPAGGDPLVKPDAKLAWLPLPGAASEASGVEAAAARQKLSVVSVRGAKATTAEVLANLPNAKVAHLATHGFFADESFRGVFRLDPKDYERSLRGERVGGAAKSPLVMTGLVCAGANHPDTPGRGIVTGEALIDLDLSGLELAVLSACETGLGDVADGQGVYGLQRAFHYAGARNVVCSLWKVDDLATAAVMGEFYRNLWEKSLAPMEALRQAQRAVYRADPKQFKEMVVRGIETGKADLSKVPELAADPKDPKAGNHPRLWAAFTLSGLGR